MRKVEWLATGLFFLVLCAALMAALNDLRM